MTTQPPDLKKLREVAERAEQSGPYIGDDWIDFIDEATPQTILALLDAYEASARDAERYRWLRVNERDRSDVFNAKCLEDLDEAVDEAIDEARHSTQGD